MSSPSSFPLGPLSRNVVKTFPPLPSRSQLRLLVFISPWAFLTYFSDPGGSRFLHLSTDRASLSQLSPQDEEPHPNLKGHPHRAPPPTPRPPTGPSPGSDAKRSPRASLPGCTSLSPGACSLQPAASLGPRDAIPASPSAPLTAAPLGPMDSPLRPWRGSLSLSLAVARARA